MISKWCIELAVAVLLSAVSTLVYAKRLLLEDSGDFVAYAELDTLVRSGHEARMWVLYDYKSKHAYLKWNYWSLRTLAAFDCETKRAQTLYYAYYEGQMGGGELIAGGPLIPERWSGIDTGSLVEKFWQIACSRDSRPNSDPSAPRFPLSPR